MGITDLRKGQRVRMKPRLTLPERCLPPCRHNAVACPHLGILIRAAGSGSVVQHASYDSHQLDSLCLLMMGSVSIECVLPRLIVPRQRHTWTQNLDLDAPGRARVRLSAVYSPRPAVRRGANDLSVSDGADLIGGGCDLVHEPASAEIARCLRG